MTNLSKKHIKAVKIGKFFRGVAIYCYINTVKNYDYNKEIAYHLWRWSI